MRTTPLPTAIFRAFSRILIYPAALCAVIAIPPYLLNLTAPDGTPLYIGRLTASAIFLAASFACKFIAAVLPQTEQ